MRFSSLVVGVSLLCLPSAAALADSFTTYDFSGSYAVTAFNGPEGSASGPVLQNVALTGTITFDNTTQSVSDVSGFHVDIQTFSPTGNLTNFNSFGDSTTTLIEGMWGYKEPLLDLSIPDSELASGMGGTICSNDFACMDGAYSIPSSDILLDDRGQRYAVYGTLTPETVGNVAPTPEPASVALLLTGVAGVATQLRRRRSQP